MTLRFTLLTLVLTLLPLSVAQAGDCPTCTTSADCTSAGGGPAFCVLHDGPVGCGSLTQLCCPGQGCGIDGSGRPSCEATGTCTVVEDLIDAGTPDAGGSDAGGTDAGGTDAGSTDAGAGSDAGARTDAGGGMDAGGTDAGPTPVSTGGCGCRAGHGSLGGLASLLAVALALVVRRRA